MAANALSFAFSLQDQRDTLVSVVGAALENVLLNIFNTFSLADDTPPATPEPGS